MKVMASISAIAILHLTLTVIGPAFAAPNESGLKATAPKSKQRTNLTDGECYGMNGTIKAVAANVCSTGKRCTRVDQDGVVINVGCIDDVKH